MIPFPDLTNKLVNSSSDKVHSRISPWLINLAYPFGYYLLLPFYFGRIEIIGQENIPQTGPVIVAPTHRSRWDALIVPFAIGRLSSGRDLRFMVTDSEIQGVQGWFIRRLGGFPVNIQRPDSGSFVHCLELLKAGEMVVIFPEGGIFQDQRVHPLKRGVARIALEVEEQQPGSGIKILPISLQYSQYSPSWGSDVTVKIGIPIDVTQYDLASLKSNAAQLTTDLKTALKDLHEGTENLLPQTEKNRFNRDLVTDN